MHFYIENISPFAINADFVNKADVILNYMLYMKV